TARTTAFFFFFFFFFVVFLSIDGGKTWFNATQSSTSGVWDYTWLTDVANGSHTLTVEATDAAGNKATQNLEF
ncbi:Ig-like domain-containing protein, partial [Salmonella enterica]|uniref:Ig-like domain-containing protein n=1 Tax=Salmonella enterica TaxID=28901 RepID=UPI000A183275